MLKEMTDSSLIRLNIEADDWQDAIRKAAQPLVENQKITLAYVEDIIKGVFQYGPYIVITKHVALPHTLPEAGALQDAIGIATLKTPVYFGNEANDPVKYLFCLSAETNNRHLSALAGLVEVLCDPDFFTMLDLADSPKQVMDYLIEKNV